MLVLPEVTTWGHDMESPCFNRGRWRVMESPWDKPVTNQACFNRGRWRVMESPWDKHVTNQACFNRGRWRVMESLPASVARPPLAATHRPWGNAVGKSPVLRYRLRQWSRRCSFRQPCCPARLGADKWGERGLKKE